MSDPTNPVNDTLPVQANRDLAEQNKIAYVSLGCPKALVDSEHIVTELVAQGYDVVAEDDAADVVVVNTCGFIDSAKAESFQAIEDALDQQRRVVVTGCLGAKQTELRAKFPQLEFVSGPADVQPVIDAVRTYLPPELPAKLSSESVSESPLDLSANIAADITAVGSRSITESEANGGLVDSRLPGEARIRLTPEHYGYLKISEGCNHKCSFCIIPDMRGKLVSRLIGDVLREAEQMVDLGTKEILLVAQDLSAYGLDLKYAPDSYAGREMSSRLFELCDALGDIAPWVRLHYVYPYPHVDNIIPLMAEGKILPYLDMPLQHASMPVLKNMRRPAAAEKALERIQRWREICPELAIRSTFIVGFPGETNDDVGELLDFLEAAQFDRVGCFTYSAVDGARANKLADHVDESDKLDRQEIVYETQAGISAARLANRVGQTHRLLVDEVTPADGVYHICARSKYDAPEIDGQVHLQSSEPVRVGDFIWGTVTHADEHDLFATPGGRGIDVTG